MSDHAAENNGCLLVAEYVDDAGEPTGSTFGIGEVIGTRVVASYLDTGDADGGAVSGREPPVVSD